ncbi:MAG: tetratricopeptide repeat protein [Lachnospiraceae bacterium]|nr:tetratricopeptide repeat protein [Lachnospiraceae bacterium]
MRRAKKGYIAALLAAMLSGACACAADSGEKEYERGVAAYEAQNYKEAAEQFAAALEKNEDKAESYLYYGYALLALGSYEEAAGQFEQVILDKSFPAVQENNKRAYRGAGIAWYRAGEAEKAISCFYAALNIEQLPEYDEDIRAYLAQTNSLLLQGQRERGEFSEMLSLCGRLLEEFGGSKELYRLRADIYMEQEQYEEALAEFELALSAGDEGMGTLLGKLTALRELGREAEAAQAAGRLAAMTPENDEEALAGAIAAFSVGDYRTAGTMFSSLYENGRSEAGYYLAQLRMAEEDYSGAAAYLEELKRAGAADEEIYYRLAVCMLELDRTEEAAGYYERLSEPDGAEQRRRRDRVYIALLEKQSRWSEAKDAMADYLKDWAAAGDEEHEAAAREYEFLSRLANNAEKR